MLQRPWPVGLTCEQPRQLPGAGLAWDTPLIGVGGRGEIMVNGGWTPTKAVTYTSVPRGHPLRHPGPVDLHPAPSTGTDMNWLETDSKEETP